VSVSINNTRYESVIWHMSAASLTHLQLPTALQLSQSWGCVWRQHMLTMSLTHCSQTKNCSDTIIFNIFYQCVQGY